MWKAIKHYPNYRVDENGNVLSLNSNRVLRPSVSKGYAQVTLMEKGVRHCLYIHKLVADAFVENPNNYPCVNHIDENKLNNTASNLEWCTYQYNNTYRNRHFRAGAKLKKAVLQFDNVGKLINSFESARAAANATGIREQSIARAARGERKTCKGFMWAWSEQSESLRIR